VRELSASELYFNSARVEAGLQMRYKEERKVGVPCADKGGYLWRVSGAGGFGLYKKWDAKNAEPKVVRLFCCYSDLVPSLIANGTLKYNE